MRFTKSGKEQHIILTEDGQEFFAGLVAGRPSNAPMFGKEWAPEPTGSPHGHCLQARWHPTAYRLSSTRHTWASLSVMNGMPLNVVANNLGHTDTNMVEKHYGHLAPSFVVDQVRKFAPRFGRVESNVKAIR